MATKTCTKCGKVKPLEGFYKRRASKDGLALVCKECARTRAEKWYADNPERAAATRRKYRAEHKEDAMAHKQKWYADNPERARAESREYYANNKDRHRNNRLQYAYGISLAEYDAMLEAQDGVCALCGKTPEENGHRLFVDHDHETGRIRGLLCRVCNASLGGLGDTLEAIERVLDYLIARPNENYM